MEGYWNNGSFVLKSTVEGRIARLEAENATLRDDVAGWKHEADGYRKNRDALSSENAALREQLEAAKKARGE